MKINFFLLFLLLMCLNNVSAMDLAEIELVDIDTMTVEVEPEKNESYYTTKDGERHYLENEHYQIVSSSYNTTLPFNSLIDSMTNIIMIVVIVTVAMPVVGAVFGSLRGGDI